jgi:hypothetical protein
MSDFWFGFFCGVLATLGCLWAGAWISYYTLEIWERIRKRVRKRGESGNE